MQFFKLQQENIFLSYEIESFKSNFLNCTLEKNSIKGFSLANPSMLLRHLLSCCKINLVQTSVSKPYFLSPNEYVHHSFWTACGFTFLVCLFYEKEIEQNVFSKVYPCLCKNNSFIKFCAKVYRKLDEREKNVKHFILNKALASFIVTVLSCTVHVSCNLQELRT